MVSRPAAGTFLALPSASRQVPANCAQSDRTTDTMPKVWGSEREKGGVRGVQEGARSQNPGVRRSGVRHSVGTIVNRVERVVGRKSRRALDRFFPKILPRRI